MWIKICANTNLADTLLAVEAGADAVGFIFAPSKRQVNAEQVAEITGLLPKHVSKVGIFTTTDAEEILNAASKAGLTDVQLHSPFEPTLIEAVKAGSSGTLGLLQVMDIAEDSSPEAIQETLRHALEHPYVIAALLDASHGGTSGGTGEPFDWNRVAPVIRQVCRDTGGRVIVAGGLRVENVGAAIDAFRPWGVDVATGVEALPGKKDATRLRAFIDEARARKH